MAVVTTALAVGAIGSKLIGGMMGAAQAKAKAEFTAAIYREQANYYDYLSTKKIAGETGTSTANVTARGVANSGSVLSTIMEDNFNAQLQKQFQIQNIERQATLQEVQGNISAQDSLVKGIGGALSSAAIANRTLRDQAAIGAANKDAKNEAPEEPKETLQGSIKLGG